MGLPPTLLMWWFVIESKKGLHATRVVSARLIVQFVETTTGRHCVQAFRREKRNAREFAKISDDYRLANLRVINLFGGLAIGELLATVLYVRNFFDLLEEVARFLHSYQSAVAALEKVSGVLGESPTVGDPSTPSHSVSRRACCVLTGSASDTEVRAVARPVNADEFMSRLPDGYDTDVNKRGGRVSAGQRQLISLSRAFLANAAVLIGADGKFAALHRASQQALAHRARPGCKTPRLRGMGTSRVLRVAVLGFGAIGARVASALASARVPGAMLAGVMTRSPERVAPYGYPVIALAGAPAACDLVVECAGGATLRDAGPGLIAAGVDLLPASLGALADPELRARLLDSGPGRCFLTAGAIGGLDLLGAAARDGGLDTVSLTSTKRAATLVQPWMTSELVHRLHDSSEAFTVFEGAVEEAIRLFPASLNVGVALAAATGMWGGTLVRLIADPAATLTNHRVRASGRSGDYDFSITNKPLPDSPQSSAVVSAALLNGVSSIARPSGSFV